MSPLDVVGQIASTTMPPGACMCTPKKARMRHEEVGHRVSIELLQDELAIVE